MAAAVDIPERRRRVKMVGWTAAWLFVLVAPAHEIVAGGDHPAAVAAGVLVAFVTLYLGLWWLISDPTSRWAARVALLTPLIALTVGGSLAFRGSWPFLFFYLSVAVAVSFPERWAVVGIAGVAVVDGIVIDRPTEKFVAGQIVGVLMSGLIVLFMIRMLRLIRELNAAREELARLAVADERLRFARDLHDLLGHTLSLIVVKSEAVRRLVHQDAEAAARESGDIEVVSRQALAEVREAVTNYRERSLEAELEGARVALSAAGIQATIHQPAERLPETVESVLGWTVREGVTNVVRHSNGHHCAIDVRRANGMAVLEICDDGDSGEVGDGNHFGAQGLAARNRSDVGAGVDGEAGADGEARADGEAGADSGFGGSPMTDGAHGRGEDIFVGAGADAGADEGADPTRVVRAGTGLRGLTERLASAHGRLEAGRRPGGGFRLAVTVPLDSEGQV